MREDDKKLLNNRLFTVTSFVVGMGLCITGLAPVLGVLFVLASLIISK